MSRVFLLLSVCFFFLENLLGQEQQQSLPSVEQISSKRTNYNLEEIKVRWKKASLENCVGAPCIYFTCGTSTVSDIEGNSYNTVSIGSQCWLKENLKVSKYNDGTLIPLDNSGGISGDNTSGGPVTWERTTGARSVHGHNNANIATYGYLYNWYAAKGIITAGNTSYKNICPTGWHVPTDAEWTIMIQTLDPSQAVNSGNVLTFTGTQSTTAGNVMKKNDALWAINTGITNANGFSALPGGLRYDDGYFDGIGGYAAFWSVTEVNADDGWNRALYGWTAGLSRFDDEKSYGNSVRCLKD
jgi:uncharacterized protein (TIGR02145 family)